MTIDIDITDKKSHEIIEIMEIYPQGSLVIKYERVFWVSDSSVPTSRGGPESSPGNRGTSPNQRKSIASGAQSALDSLGSMMGPPQRAPPPQPYPPR